MIQLPEGFDSVFRYIVVVSQRAEQLINGAKPRSESQHAKRTLMAKDDVDEKLVSWRILTQEELDAQRQAMVEQFRAEVGGVTELQAQPAIPDVLPTGSTEEAVAAPVVEQDAEKDDELSRLQRLLGMVGGAAQPEAVADEKPKKGAAEEKEEEISLDLEDGDANDFGEKQDGETAEAETAEADKAEDKKEE
ncbi:MAG: DNA-directed RNA polymerase subunit omega [bacterium]|nr:DNA-directed RNA polymerase subunit omega [bacterium]